MSFIRDSKALLLLSALFVFIITTYQLRTLRLVDRIHLYFDEKKNNSPFLYIGNPLEVIAKEDESVFSSVFSNSLTIENNDDLNSVVSVQPSDASTVEERTNKPKRKVLWGRKRFRGKETPTHATPSPPIKTESPTFPLSEVPTNTTEKDYHLSKFSRRFRLSNRTIKMSKLEQENLTYFPRDHVTDGHVYTLRKFLNQEEKSIMQEQMPLFQSFLPFYTNFSRYLSTRYVSFKKYWTEEEKSQYESLSEERKERFTHYLFKKYEDKTIDDEKKRIHQREELIKKHLRYSEDGRCEGCRYFDTANYHLTQHYHGTIRKFKGNTEVFTIYNSTYYRFPSSDTPFSITGVCVTTLERLVLLPQLLYRWEGPLVLVLNGAAIREGEIITYINSHYLPPRLTILVYLMSTRYKGGFPVNMLRNMGIRNIETTHYQILDMDLLPTTNAYSEMMKLPSFLREGKRAVILPVFFFDRKAMLVRCSDVKTCALLTAEAMPENKLQLEACLHSKVCLSSKPGIRTHIYIMPEWYGNSSSPIARIRCFTADFQEPYVLLRYDETTPLFDERFVNYGYNKVQLFEHLRAAGYTFYIWNSIFAMDLPHPDSSLRKEYIDKIKGETSEMRELYKDFQAELNAKYKMTNPTRICFSLQKRYFLDVDLE